MTISSFSAWDYIKDLAIRAYHSRDGVGSYFWIMRSTFMPAIFIVLAIILQGAALLLRGICARIMFAAGSVEKPYSFLSVSCACTAAFFALVATLLKR
jgi:hypothetical protein